MDIKVRNRCSLRITFTYPDGSKVDIRNSKILLVTLILPDKKTKPIKDVGFDDVTGTIFVRLFGENDIQTIGAYSICINVQDKDTRMLSTVNTPIFNAAQNAYDGYRSIVLSLALYTVETPENITITGASPQISPQQTWLVYDDTLNHESIHTAQMRELLYLGFYLAYVIEWCVRLLMCGNAYRNISFEREAYSNESDLEYLKKRKHFAFLNYLKKVK